MKKEREIAELIFDKFRSAKCKTNEIVSFRTIQFDLIDKLNPKEKELFYKVFAGLQALDYFTYEKDGLESIRLTKKGHDYIYDDKQIELMTQKPWVIPEGEKTDWNKAFNTAWKVINESGSPYYLSQTPFYNLVRKINDSLPPYANYLAQREKAGKSRSREYVYYDLIDELPVEKRFEFYVTLQEYIEKTNPVPTPAASVPFIEQVQNLDPVIPSPTSAASVSFVEQVQNSDPVIPLVIEDEAPTVFISYSWDSPEHRDWVLNLATKLKENHVNVILDKWNSGSLGEPLPNFMEKAISKSNRVICVLTPNYKMQTDKLEGGVSYEYSIIAAEIFADGVNTSKFIPLIRKGAESESVPTAFRGRKYVDMRDDAEFEDKFVNELLRDIHNASKYKKPALEVKPKFD
ncbi:MAG: hypothetical protein PWQ72_1221 [Pseudothermotoga sp.]|jgi:hypothetical protein|nr:hypothetical protein [Pseudothermotoga sp.]